MYDALWKAGYGPEGDLLMLATRGAEFQSHLARTSAQLTGVSVDEAALERRLNQKIDLISNSRDAITYARNHGGPTEASEGMLAMLEDIMRSGEAHRMQQEGPVAHRTLSTLLTAQAGQQ